MKSRLVSAWSVKNTLFSGNNWVLIYNQMNNLTPGDFATVRRQSTLLGETLTTDEFLNRLKQEAKAKPDSGNRPIGFIS